jgi:tripartite-type tricarboxylate transporter receptor subunit TctC
MLSHIRFPSRARRGHTARCALAMLCLVVCGYAGAAEWVPQRPLRLIVPFPPGGTADLLARLLAPPMGAALGQQIVVDNRGGAGGVIAMEAVAHAQPDGYTFGIPSLSAHASNATLAAQLPYDSIKDFLPLTFVAQSPVVLVVHPSNPALSVQDMIARAKAAGRPINFASSGIGVVNHIAGERLKLEAKADMVHVPYKGGGPAMVDVMGGQIEMMFNPVSSVLPFVNGGKLRALAIADRRRSTLLPNVATMAESGFADFFMLESWGLVAPAGTPPDAARRLRAEAVKALQQPDIVARYTGQGVELLPSTPERLRDIIAGEIKKYRDIIQRAGIKAN